ncbi:gastric triacylglycerol lipase-like [Haemaphysalis longicornis]
MRKFGYNVEVHKVTTEDGYIQEVDRIPHPPTGRAVNQRPAVLLVHGIMANAVSWVANFPSQSPGRINNLVQAINDFLARGGFLVQSQAQRNLLATACNSPLRDICYAPVAVLCGKNPKQLNKTRIPVYVANNLVGTSSQDVVHYAQVYKQKNLVRYDYGKEENQARYGQVRNPPEYPLENIRVPIAVFKGKLDKFADPKDVEDLIKRLRDIIVTDYEVPDPDFGHLDFIYGYNATDILHRPMIQLLSNYTSPGSN